MQLISFFFLAIQLEPQNNIQEVIINRLCHLGCGKLCGGFFDEGIRSALTQKKFLVSKGIYRQYIGTGCTRLDDNF